LRRGDWTCRRWFLLSQLGGGHFHRAADRDANNTFVLVDPSVRIQRLLRVFAHGFQSFHALFRPLLFVITSARRGANHHEHNQAE
jgi:hypothetical protein